MTANRSDEQTKLATHTYLHVLWGALDNNDQVKEVAHGQLKKAARHLVSEGAYDQMKEATAANFHKHNHKVVLTHAQQYEHLKNTHTVSIKLLITFLL